MTQLGRESLVQPPAESRISAEFKPGCSGGENLQGQRLPASLGNLFHCCLSSWWKFFSSHVVGISHSNFWPLSHSSTIQLSEELWWSPCRYGKASIRSPQSYINSWQNKLHSLSISWLGRYSSPLDHFDGPSLSSFQFIYICLVPGDPPLHTAFPIQSNRSPVKGNYYFHWPTGYSPVDAA